MKIQEITEDRIPLTTPQNMEGFTFGFEVEFCIRYDWIINNNWESIVEDEIGTVSIDEDDLDEYFYVDEHNLNREFRSWQEDHSDEDMDAFLQAYGIEKLIEEGYLTPYDNVVIKNEMIYKLNTTDYNVHYLVQDDLSQDVDYEIEVFGTAKQQEKELDKYYIEPDSTIEVTGDGDTACEITSPVFRNYDEFINNLRRVLNFVQQIGYTNTTCGLHINIGIPPGKKPDFVKMAAFMGQQYLQKVFKRKSNEYTQSHDEFFQKIIAAEPDDEEKQLELFPQLFDVLIKKLNNGFSNISEKYYVFNVIPYNEGKGYVEFRVLGGKGYEEKFPLVSQNINRFLFLMNLACNPTMYRREYMKKIYAMLNNYRSGPVSENIFVTKVKEYLKSMKFRDEDIAKIFEDGKVSTKPAQKQAYLLAIFTLMHEGFAFPEKIFGQMFKQMNYTSKDIEDWNKYFEYRIQVRRDSSKLIATKSRIDDFIRRYE